MKTYVCDSCERIIDNPYILRMKEFYFAWDAEYGKVPVKSKHKIHLCNTCFRALHDIANRRAEKNG